jgi:hypothetical protein
MPATLVDLAAMPDSPYLPGIADLMPAKRNSEPSE